MTSEIELNSIQTSLEEGKNLLEKKCVICLEMDEKSKPVVKPEELKCECHTYFHPACFNEYQLNFNKCPTCNYMFISRVIQPLDFKMILLVCLGIVWNLTASVFILAGFIIYDDISSNVSVVVVSILIFIFICIIHLVSYILILCNQCCSFVNTIRLKADLTRNTIMFFALSTVLSFLSVFNDKDYLISDYPYMQLGLFIEGLPSVVVFLMLIIYALLSCPGECRTIYANCYDTYIIH